MTTHDGNGRGDPKVTCSLSRYKDLEDKEQILEKLLNDRQKYFVYSDYFNIWIRNDNDAAKTLADLLVKEREEKRK